MRVSRSRTASLWPQYLRPVEAPDTEERGPPLGVLSPRMRSSASYFHRIGNDRHHTLDLYSVLFLS